MLQLLVALTAQVAFVALAAILTWRVAHGVVRPESQAPIALLEDAPVAALYYSNMDAAFWPPLFAA